MGKIETQENIYIFQNIISECVLELCRNNHSLRLVLVNDSCAETHFVTSSTCIEIHNE